MSKINIDRIVKDIKSKTTSLTPVIEAVCNSIDAIGPERTDGVIDIIVKRTGQRSLNLDNAHTLSDIVSIDIADNGIGFTEENKMTLLTPIEVDLRCQKEVKVLDDLCI